MKKKSSRKKTKKQLTVVAHHRGIPGPLQRGPPLLEERVPDRAVAVGVGDVPGVDEQAAVEGTGVESFLLPRLLRRRRCRRCRRLQVRRDRGRGVSRGGEDPARGLRRGGRVSCSCFGVFVFFAVLDERVSESFSFVCHLFFPPFPSSELEK